MRSQKKKVKLASRRKIKRSYMGISGGISCVGLLLLLCLLVNPFVGTPVDALGEVDDSERGEDGASVPEYVGKKQIIEGDETNIDGSITNADSINYDNQIMTTADTNTSIVGISFSPAQYYASLSPTTEAGQSARIDITATVNVYNSGGYTVYLKSNDARLVGVSNNSNTIPGATVAKTYTDMDVNTWGYASAEDKEVPINATYKAVGVSGNGDILAENKPNDNIDADTKTIALSFAAKIDDSVEADVYSNTMMLSVVSSPVKTVTIARDFGIGTMQEMTSDICAGALDKDDDGEISGQLQDTRDGKYYWVNKLADNNCWMTQNLDLDLSTTTKLLAETSDVSDVGWTPGFTTATSATSDTVNDGSSTETRSWDLGNYRITNPVLALDCGDGKNSLVDCTGQFTYYATPTTANNDINAHYIVGNYYQWNAATAGSGGNITSGQATDSICPRGWRLPESNTTTSGSFGGLIDSGSIGTDTLKLVSAPYYFVRGGNVDQRTKYLFSSAGGWGYYWSSTPVSTNASLAYYLHFYSTSRVSPSRDDYRYQGLSVRCIAR